MSTPNQLNSEKFQSFQHWRSSDHWSEQPIGSQNVRVILVKNRCEKRFGTIRNDAILYLVNWSLLLGSQLILLLVWGSISTSDCIKIGGSRFDCFSSDTTKTKRLFGVIFQTKNCESTRARRYNFQRLLKQFCQSRRLHIGNKDVGDNGILMTWWWWQI